MAYLDARNSELCSRGMFLSIENVASINGRLRLRGSDRYGKEYMKGWWIDYMASHRIERAKIDNVMEFKHMMTDIFVQKHAAANVLHHEEVPYVPWAVGGAHDTARIHNGAATGRWPKYKIQSMVEDMPDSHGQSVVRKCHQPIRMVYQPRQMWHGGKAVPDRQTIWSRGNLRLIDKDEVASGLTTFELLNRQHTVRDVQPYLTNENTNGRGAPNTHIPWVYEEP